MNRRQRQMCIRDRAYMLAQSIAEAASGINKLVDRVLELVDQDKA